MPRVDSIRQEVHRLVNAAPFRPFALTLENGNQVIIEHPENIAFDPTATGAESEEFYVISKRLRLFSNFSAATAVALADRG